MASIDRHQYSAEIRKGAAKFVKDLNLESKTSTNSVPRKSLNGENGLHNKVSSNLSSKLEYFQKLPSNLRDFPFQNGRIEISGLEHKMMAKNESEYSLLMETFLLC